MVPNGWEKYPVGKLCRSIVPGRNKPKTFDGTIPWVTTPEISGKYIPSIKQRNYISKDVASQCGAKIVPAGAVVIAAVGELGLTAIAKQDVILNQQLHAFVCPEKVNNEFLAYFLSAQKPYMDTVASKTTIPYMNKTNCESIPILLPPLPEQQKIAKILSTWDKAINTSEKLITTNKQQKKALMQQLLTGKKRLLNPDTGKAFEGEWEEVKLGDASSIYDGTHSTPKYVESGVPFYSVEHLTRNDFSKTKFISEDVFEKENKRVKLEYGDILMTRIGDIGTAKCLDWDVRASFYVSLALIKANTDKFDSTYMSNYINSHEFHRELHKRTIHVAFPKKINLGEINNCYVLLPNINEQQKIASVLTAADKEIEIVQAKLSLLKQEKKALMQQLLTGKRRVKTDDVEVA